LHDLPSFTQSRIFGFKIYHLSTLICTGFVFIDGAQLIKIESAIINTSKDLKYPTKEVPITGALLGTYQFELQKDVKGY
jgi:hypothetical protein